MCSFAQGLQTAEAARVLRQEQAEADRVARNLVRELGGHASAVAALRAEGCRAAVDVDGVVHWLEVARRIDALLAGETAPSAAWRMMQRIELYRHRATQAERRAALDAEELGAGELRQALIEIAAQWRDLALQAQLLAERAPATVLAEEPRRRRQGSA